MPSLGVNVVALEAGKVLLTRREDFEAWRLPGGGIEENETIADNARREAWEEVGLEVQLKRLEGVYSEPRWHHRGLPVFLFAGESPDEALRLQLAEVVEARFFAQDDLPEDYLLGHRQRALHAFAGLGGGVAWRQPGVWKLPGPLNRQQIYNLRDRSGLSHSEFFRRYLGEYDPAQQVLEVGSDDRSFA